MGFGMNWDLDAICLLTALWHEGHSTAEIGRRLGISKNAVCGKAHRIDLPSRPSPLNEAKTFDHDEARRLRSLNYTYVEIGRILGISADTAAFAARDMQKIVRSNVTIPKLASEADPVPVPKPSPRPAMVPVGIVPATTKTGQHVYVRGRTCAAVMSNGRPWRFCEEPVERGSYCKSHAEAYHVKPDRNHRRVKEPTPPMFTADHVRVYG